MEPVEVVKKTELHPQGTPAIIAIDNHGSPPGEWGSFQDNSLMSQGERLCQ